MDLELITDFNPGKTFDEALLERIQVSKDEIRYNILIFSDLLISKIATDRLKEKLDIEELQRIRLQRKKD